MLHTEKFLSDEEREEIRRCVAAAEATTSGEIATMVVSRSDSYREAETLGAVLMAGTISLICSVATLHVTIWTYIPLVFLLFLPARALVRKFPVLKLPFVGRRRIAEAVRERAIRAFFEKKLYKTRHETGILIFVSVLERKVWILADRGIDKKIARQEWQELARVVSTGIREGRPAEALCNAIARCGSFSLNIFRMCRTTGMNFPTS